MHLEKFFQAVVSGILSGGVYALIAVGLTLVFGVMNIVNFAHGSFLMLGMYISYWLFALFGLHPYISMFASLLVLFFLGMLFQRYLIEYVHTMGDQSVLLLTFGISMFLENLAVFLWTPDYRSIQVNWFSGTTFVYDIMISIPKLMAFIFSVLLTALLYLFLKKTDIGKSIRAISDQIEGARSGGINVSKVSQIAFGIGAACVAAAGSIITPFFYTAPSVGFVFLLTAFIVVVIGGMGNFWGAFFGGIIVALGESLGATYLPGSLQHLGMYLIFILVLLFRPQGIFGKRA
jgi:branched-chain amino acid transport system permease protein